jgi:hypothetical protein
MRAEGQMKFFMLPKQGGDSSRCDDETRRAERTLLTSVSSAWSRSAPLLCVHGSARPSPEEPQRQPSRRRLSL